MNSEKVKEIKNSIERKINRAEKVGDDLVNCVSVVALKGYLTLINELESENKRLENKNYQLEQDLGQCENGYKLELHTARYQLHSANVDLQKLKDRIADLEKENEILQGTKDRLTFADRIKLVDKTRNRTIEEFATELKSIYQYLDGDVDIPVKTIREDIDCVIKALSKFKGEGK